MGINRAAQRGELKEELKNSGERCTVRRSRRYVEVWGRRRLNAALGKFDSRPSGVLATTARHWWGNWPVVFTRVRFQTNTVALQIEQNIRNSFSKAQTLQMMSITKSRKQSTRTLHPREARSRARSRMSASSTGTPTSTSTSTSLD